MAVSALAGAPISSLKVEHSDFPVSSSVTKLSSLNSLLFSPQLRRLPFGRQQISSRSHHRILLPVGAKKQTYSSIDDLLTTSERPVLVDFYATWCGPCQFMGPILNEVGAKLKEMIQVVKIDTEKYPSIANKYKVEALPTFILFKDGQPLDRFEGAMTVDQLVQRIEALLKVKH